MLFGLGLGVLGDHVGATSVEAAPPEPDSVQPPPEVPRPPQPVFAGVLVASRTATVRAPFSGRVASIEVELSERVPEGHVLARLDPTRREFDYDASRARLRSSRADLRHAEAADAAAKKDLKRARRLHEKGLIPDEEFERTETEATLSALSARSAHAAVERLESESAAVRFDARDALLVSPLGGAVVGRYASPGERVEEGAALVRVADTTRVLVRFGIDEHFAGRFQPGDVVSVAPVAEDEASTRATVVHVAVELDPTARLAVAEAELEERPPHWPVGLALRVRPQRRSPP